jgi:excisionase family DNA binding protein
MNAERRESLMRVREVARDLDQSVSAVYRKIAARDLPAVRLGGSPRAPIRVRADELKARLYRPPTAIEEDA